MPWLKKVHVSSPAPTLTAGPRLPFSPPPGIAVPAKPNPNLLSSQTLTTTPTHFNSFVFRASAIPLSGELLCHRHATESSSMGHLAACRRRPFLSEKPCRCFPRGPADHRLPGESPLGRSPSASGHGVGWSPHLMFMVQPLRLPEHGVTLTEKFMVKSPYYFSALKYSLHV
ncbi:hypothetical protein HPP92_009404 [Vanilla planifolia]|uniref:Uncharacterized protein n=1 Tax=Vanilla planifolia TaxID=51239 RepID=A0A835RA79_VANPL|nr:hypothetical protein HPP92_009404 [Vanilla planifolia]